MHPTNAPWLLAQIVELLGLIDDNPEARMRQIGAFVRLYAEARAGSVWSG